MNLKPLGDRVVVEREEAKGTTAGGIVLPDTAKDKPQKGKVVSVGEGRVATRALARSQTAMATASRAAPQPAT